MKDDLKDIALLTFIILSGIIVFVTYFDKGKSIYLNNENNSLAEARIEKDVIHCGLGYYASLFSIKDHLTNTGEKEAVMVEQYGFVDIVGMGYKVIPTKTFNQNWSESISIDDKYSLDFIHSLKDVTPVYYSNLDKLLTVPVIKTLLDRSNIKPKSASVVIIKEHNNIIYAYILSNTNPHNTRCEKEKGLKMLKKTSKFIKNLL